MALPLPPFMVMLELKLCSGGRMSERRRNRKTTIVARPFKVQICNSPKGSEKFFLVPRIRRRESVGFLPFAVLGKEQTLEGKRNVIVNQLLKTRLCRKPSLIFLFNHCYQGRNRKVLGEKQTNKTKKKKRTLWPIKSRLQPCGVRRRRIRNAHCKTNPEVIIGTIEELIKIIL